MNNKDYMKMAIELARNTVGQTAPNPAVGAVIVSEGRIVGMGAHLKAGEPHAEVYALRMAGEKAKGATAYVTLEPCSHHGKTPPCANALIDAGITEVYVAMQDPNPLVGGRGIERLKDAGITVHVGLLEEEAYSLNDVFFHYIETNRPYVTLKSAVSLDGKVATKTGDSKWITGSEARQDVHAERHQHDAILVGVGTVEKDDPSLTTRYGEGISPIRVILDRTLRLPSDAVVLQDDSVETWIITTKKAKNETKRMFSQHVTVLAVEGDSISIDDVLHMLGDRGVTSVFVEGGPTINGSFLEAGAFQKVITYVAPKLIGGTGAPTSFEGNGIATMQDTLELTIESVEQIGDDIKIISKRRCSDVYRYR
ncbi:bifunctional diaminohydroxyphosphoribosylaminopyrimidine deaminase/5-amino-6-(5-phosphoribosylamino)uracil reductase RibD [Alkalihalobacillus sp. CinArs1]|uniref:bifunctional diaminohydroxyphosphoribosylaminopyrimidine deaminase/5-amino-6-(5-phosphoribosylamino)uracil reductase RibD n=1 Tax=Alkalihalobacillus sp. CinArs1 TaxID=2995314 RepID=UPI003FA44B79